MIPASVFGPFTAGRTLNGPLPVLHCPGANHTGVLWLVRARINHSTGVSTKEQEKEDGVSVLCMCSVVRWCRGLYCSQGKGYVCVCL